MASRRRFLLVCGCVLAIAVGPDSRAQAPGEGSTPAAPATPQAEDQKIPWWGGRFALYLETGVGGASTEDVNTSAETSIQQVTYSAFAPGDRSYGRVVVGWQLPLNRGLFALRYSGYKEDGSWELNSTGAASFVPGFSDPTDAPIAWWSLHMSENQLTATRNPPAWNNLDGDNEVDADEVIHTGVDQTSVTSGPSTLQQRSRTFDLIYQREFADKGPTDRWTGRWTGGLRHYELEGAIPVATWLSSVSSTPPGLFSEGALLRPLLLNQDTTGNGPAGTLELQYHFLRRRATAYAQGRAAFLLQQLTVDSGQVYTLTRTTQPDALYPTPLHLTHEVDKTAWQVGAEVGVRFRFLPGFVGMVEYHTDANQDVLLLPDRLNIPNNIQEAPFGSNAIYTTKDIDHDGWSAGLSFQF
jgi:hypothetical protein